MGISTNSLGARQLMIGATASVAVAAFIAALYGYAYDRHSALERFSIPALSLSYSIMCACYCLAPKRWFHALDWAFILSGGLFLIIAFIDGAINPAAHIEYYLIWTPGYYLALVMGKKAHRPFHWVAVFFIVANLSMLTAVHLGPISWSDDRSLLLITIVFGQAFWLCIVYAMSHYFGQRTVQGTRIKILEETADVLTYAAKEAHAARTLAENANKAKSNFIANMSHELRTPINAVLGFAQVLRADQQVRLKTEKHEDYFEHIENSAQQLLQLVNRLIDFSDLETGKIEGRDTAIGVVKLAQNAIEAVSADAERKKIKITLGDDVNMPDLYADARLLKQALINLLSNAVKFTPEGGLVRLSADYSVAHGFCFSVTDTGIGMDQKIVDRLMLPFEQLEHSYSRGHGGVGLGLSLVKSICEIHDGSFELTSQRDKGTVAMIKIPASRAVEAGQDMLLDAI